MVRAIAAASSAAAFVASLWLWSNFNSSTSDFQFVEKFNWISTFNIHYFMAIDGLSLTMVVLTTLLTLLSVIASFGIELRVKEYFFFFLLLETAMLGVFVSLDLFLFYVFWELTLVPMYFLIGIWGGPKKEYAAIKFFLFTLFGSVFMLIALLALYFNTTPHTFDYLELLKQSADVGAKSAAVDFPRTLSGICGQNSGISVPHLASIGPCGSPDGRLRHSGRCPAQDGNLRDHALFVTAPADGGATAGFRIGGDRDH